MIDLDVIFRSIINFKNKDGKETISQKDLLKNFRALQDVIPQAPEEKAYKVLYHAIYDYIKECDADVELPSFDYLRHRFETTEGNETVLSILEKVAVQKPYIGQDFRTVLKEYREEQHQQILDKLLNDSSKIASVGMEIGKGRKKTKIKGVDQAIAYFGRESAQLQREITGVKTRTQIVSAEDSKEVQNEYDRAKADPTEAIGINTWLKQFDEGTGGLKRSELMSVVAFTGHCKSTFCRNMAYRALYAGWNTSFITLEMGCEETRRYMYVLHSCNPRFKDIYPEYADVVGKISVNNVAYGRLTEKEEKYFKLVCEDFDLSLHPENESYGRFFLWQPEEAATLSNMEMKLRQDQQQLQAVGRDLEFVVIDYISLMTPDVWERDRDGNETTNKIIKNLKQLCLRFNRGKGVRLLSPHQANREGYKEAKKNEGLYGSTAASNAHEIERTCDLVMALYLFDEDGDNDRIKFSCLKNRRNKKVRPFDACINFESGFIYNYSHAIENSDNIEVVDLV